MSTSKRNIPPPAREQEERRSLLGRVVRSTLFALLGASGAVLLLLLLLQTQWGANRLRVIAEDRLNGMLENATVQIGRLDGNLLSHAEITGLRIVRSDGSTLLGADSISARYRFLPLLLGRVRIRDLSIVRPFANPRQLPDQTWDLMTVFSKTPEGDPSASASTLSMELERFRLRGGRIEAAFYAAGRDSTFSLYDADAAVRHFRVGENLSIVIDTVSAQFESPITSGVVDVAAGGALSEGRLDITGLRLESESSHVRGSGSLALASFVRTESRERSARPAQPSRFSFAARPLSFADIHAFVPALNPDASAEAAFNLEELDSIVSARGIVTFAGGGTVDLAADMALPSADAVAYDVELTARQIDLSNLLEASRLPKTGPTVLDAELTAELSGPSLATVNGTVELTVDGIPPVLEKLGPTRASGSFESGSMRFRLATSWDQLHVSASGTARPFDDTPVYDLSVDVQDFDAGAFLVPQQTLSDVDATISVTGRGLAPASAEASLSVSILPSSVNRMEIRTGSLTGSMADGHFSWGASVELGDGMLAFNGQATLADTPAFRILDGRFTDINLAAIAGDTTSSNISGTFDAEGSGNDTGNLDMRGNLAVSGGSYGPYQLPEARLSAQLRNQVLRVTAEGRYEDGGAISASGRVRPFEDEMSFVLEKGSFSRIDLARIGLGEAYRTELNGSVRASGQGASLETLRLDAQIQMDLSVVNQQSVSSGKANLRLDHGQVEFDLFADAQAGTITVAGHGSPFGDVPSFSIDAGSFKEVNLGPLLGRDSIQSMISGTFDAAILGAEPDSLRFDARIDLEASKINRTDLTQGSLKVRQEGGEARFGLDVHLASGGLTLQGSGRFLDETPTYSMEGAIEHVDLASLTGIDSTASDVSLSFGLEGEGLIPESMRLTSYVNAAGGLFGGVRIDTIDVRLNLLDGVLNASNLLLQSSLMNAEGSGTVALFDTTRSKTSRFLITSYIGDLEPIRSRFGLDVLRVQTAKAIMAVGGTSDQLKLDLGITSTALVYDDLHVAEFNGRITGSLDAERRLQATTANATVQMLSTPAIAMEKVVLEGEYDEDLFAYFGEIRFDQRRNGTFSGQLDLSGDVAALTVDAIDFTTGRDEWALRSPATLRYGDRYILGNTVLSSGIQQLVIAGTIDPGGQQNAFLRATNVDVAPFAGWFGLERLGGALNASLILSGAASQPRLAGTLDFDIMSNGTSVGDVGMSLLYDSLKVKVDATITDGLGSTASILGYIPIDLRLDRSDEERRTLGDGIAFHVNVDAASIAWMRPFIDREFADVRSGILTADMDVSGTLEAPVMGGALQLENASIRLPEFGLTYERISLRSTLKNNRILVEAAEVHSGEGIMEAHGSIDFTTLMNSSFNLNLALSSFRAVENEEYQATVSGEMVLSGRTTEPRLEGRMRLANTDIFLTEYAGGDLEQVSLTLDDERMLEDVFGYRVNRADTTAIDFYTAMELSLDVTLERDTWIRQRANPEMAIEMAGRLEISKEAHSEDLLLFRSIDVIPERSFIKQFGRRFNITTGTVSFNGPVSEMVMDIGARYEVLSRLNPGEPEATITLALSGRIDDLRFELGSDPAMDNTDIVSYIATGRPASQSLQFGGVNQGDGILGLAAGQLAGVVEGVAGENLGLDVIEIQQDGLRGTQLTAGKYLSGRTYVGISQPISFGGQSTTQASESREVAVEYKVFEWLLLQILGDTSTSAVHLNLTGRYSF